MSENTIVSDPSQIDQHHPDTQSQNEPEDNVFSPVLVEGQAPAESPDVHVLTAPMPPLKPVRRGPKVLWIVLSIVLVLLLGAGGGFAYLRLTETRLLDQAKTSLASGDWASVVANCIQLKDLPANLLEDPLRCLPMRGEAYHQMGRLDEAMADLQAAQSRYPELARPYLLATEIYLKQGKTEQALTSAIETQKRDPSLARPFMIAAEIYLQQGKNDQALTAAGEAQKRDDSLALPYTLQAVEAYRKNDYKNAQDAAAAAIKRDARQAPAFRVLGGLQVWRGEYKAAMESLNKAVELDPKDSRALSNRALLNLFQDHFDAFVSDYEKTIAVSTTLPESLVVQAAKADLDQDPAKALDLINQAIQLDPTRPEYYYLRVGFNHLTDKGSKSDLADLEKALEMSPDFFGAQAKRDSQLFNLYEPVDIHAEGQRLMKAAPETGWGESMMFYAYWRENDLEQALVWANKLIDLLPDSTSGYLLRGGIYLDMDEFEKAQADFEQAQKLYPASLLARSGKAQVSFQQKAMDEALKFREEIVNLAPKQAWPYTERSYSYSVKKEEEKARSDLDRALEIDPNNVSALIQRVYLNLADKDYTKATEDITRIYDVAPKAPTAYKLKADVYLAQDDAQRALDEAKKAIEIHKTDYYSQLLAGKASYQLKKYDEALTFANESVRLQKNNPTAYGLMASIYFDKKDYEQTLTAGQAALKLDSDMGWVYLLMAEANTSLGNYAAASDNFKSALDFKNLIQVDHLQEIEQKIAFYKTIPPLVSGLRTVSDKTNGFSIAYPAFWTPKPNQHKNTFHTISTPETQPAVVTVITVPVEAQFANQITVSLVADYYRQSLSLEGFKFTTRKQFKGVEFGLYDDFEISDGKETVRGRIYYFYTPGRMGIVQFYAPDNLFTKYLTDAESVAATFKFIK
jgi:tetratricopeptide (TPR) repeat protein